MRKILFFIKHLFFFSVFLLGMNSAVQAKLPVEKVEKDNAKVLFSQDENESDSDDDDDAVTASENQGELFDEIINLAKAHHDHLEKENSELSPRKSLLKSLAEDNAENAALNRNHVDTVDPLRKEGHYLYNLDASRERGRQVMEQGGLGSHKKESELSLASSFSDISHHKVSKKKKVEKEDSKTIEEYKLKAKKLSELKDKENKKKKKDPEKDVTYRTQAEALSDSFK